MVSLDWSLNETTGRAKGLDAKRAIYYRLLIKDDLGYLDQARG
jgi:hypothetical protein